MTTPTSAQDFEPCPFELLEHISGSSSLDVPSIFLLRTPTEAGKNPVDCVQLTFTGHKQMEQSSRRKHPNDFSDRSAGLIQVLQHIEHDYSLEAAVPVRKPVRIANVK